MTVPVIQAHYEQLEQIANKFRDQQELVATQQRAVQHAYQPLQQGGWQGKGSHAFTSEMDQEIFPALNRLHHALGEGEATVRQIITIMRAAEQEASQPFRNGSSDVVETAITSGTGAGAHIANNVGSDGIVKPAVDVYSLFAPNKMKQMVGKKWQGESSEQLRNAMNVLNGNPTPEQAQKALDDIAEARGVDRKELAAQYEVFKQLQRQQVQEPPVEQLLPVLYKNYMGSRNQLRSGDIVGQAFGIDAAFGALLNPTGGMPGPGQFGIPVSESAVGLHSAAHDAAGFLKVRFGLGPGYDYLNREPSRNPNHSFTGQESGLAYWNEIMNQRGLQHKVWDYGNIATATGSALGRWVDFTETPVYKVGNVALDVMDVVMPLSPISILRRVF